MDFNVDYIRNRLINTASGAFVALLLPSLAASLSRSLTFGWSPLYLIHILVGINMVSIFVFRNKLSIDIKYHMFTLAAIVTGLVGLYYRGLVGAYSFIILATVVSILGLGRKMTMLYVGFALAGMILIGFFYVQDILFIDFSLEVYNASIPGWLAKIFTVVLISFTIIYSISLFNSFFLKAFEEIRSTSKRLNEARIEAEESLAFLPIPIMIINANLEIVYVNNKYKEGFGDCVSEGLTFNQWLNNLYESESEKNLTFNSIKDELQNIIHIKEEIKPFSVGLKCFKDEVRSVELSIKKVNERFLLSMVDVTERIEYQNTLIVKERELQIQNEQLQTNTEELRQQNEEFVSMNEEVNQSYFKMQAMNLDLQEAKEKAEESDRLKSAFLSNMSHEIRTPMNGIIGFADLLSETQLTDDDRTNYTAIISKSSKQLLNVVNDIIDFSKIEAGAIEVFNSEMDIYESLMDLKLFFEPMAMDKGLELIYGTNLCADECLLVSDHTKLKQVLTNLLSNAIKFTSSGTVKFGAEKEGENMMFYVEDNGIGISSEKVGLVFERFRKVSEDTPGTGLGLAISKSYVETLGGELKIESESGKGTRFYFSIPITKIDESKRY